MLGQFLWGPVIQGQSVGSVLVGSEERVKSVGASLGGQISGYQDIGRGLVLEGGHSINMEQRPVVQGPKF